MVALRPCYVLCLPSQGHPPKPLTLSVDPPAGLMCAAETKEASFIDGETHHSSLSGTERVPRTQDYLC